MGTEQWSYKSAREIGSRLGYEEEAIHVLGYGLFVLIQTIISVFFVALVGGLCGVLIEALVISFAIAILRKASGGAHASSAERCILLGTITAVGGALICRWLVQISVIQVIIISIVGLGWSYYIIYKKAPVASSTKPIKNVSKIERLKRRSLLIVTIYGVLVIGCIAIQTLKAEYNIQVYGLCLLLGMCWQVFALTSLGYRLIHRLDLFLINISQNMRRNKNEKN